MNGIGVRERVTTLVREQLRIKESKDIDFTASLVELGADELDIVELCMTIEEEFERSIPDQDWDQLKNINDIVTYVQ